MSSYIHLSPSFIDFLFSVQFRTYIYQGVLAATQFQDAAARLIGKSHVHRKEPITQDIIGKFISFSNLDNLIDLRNVYMTSLAFMAFLRSDDLLNIRRKDLVFHDSCLEIHIPKLNHISIENRIFQRHGRWKSVSSKNMYVKDSLEAKLSVSKALAL